MARTQAKKRSRAGLTILGALFAGAIYLVIASGAAAPSQASEFQSSDLSSSSLGAADLDAPGAGIGLLDRITAEVYGKTRDTSGDSEGLGAVVANARLIQGLFLWTFVGGLIGFLGAGILRRATRPPAMTSSTPMLPFEPDSPGVDGEASRPND